MNMNMFPFLLRPVRISIRNVLPFVDYQCKGTLYHTPVRVFTSLPLLLPPRFALLVGPLGVTSKLRSNQHAQLPNSLQLLDS